MNKICFWKVVLKVLVGPNLKFTLLAAIWQVVYIHTDLVNTKKLSIVTEFDNNR